MSLLYTELNVGGGLPPMAVGQLKICQLTLPHRGQAPSHILTAFYWGRLV